MRVLRVLAVAGVLLVGLVAVVLLTSQQGEGETGAGFTFRGEFYVQSGAEVLPDRLGPVLERDVAIRDTSTDVRAISGVEEDVAVAARISDWGGGPSEDGVAWLLMSPDDDAAALPWSDPDLAAAVHPEE